MKVFTAALGTETNTFSTIPTQLCDFEDCYLLRPGEHPDHPLEFTAPLWIARERGRTSGWQVIEGTCAVAPPAGPAKRAVYEQLRNEILEQISAALPLDAVAVCMHGAMVADGYDDCEGDTLVKIRAIVGPATAIGIELDPHCHLTTKMTDHADAIVMFKEYPHTDFLDRAEELLDILEAKVSGRIDPTMSVFDCRMLSLYHTTQDPMVAFLKNIKSLEARDGILSISIAHGFPWGDVADTGTKILVITDNDRQKGQRLARKLGQELFALRGTTFSTPMGLHEAVKTALAANEGTVVVADISDNPGGGAPGDSTFVLSEFIQKNAVHTCFGPLWDPAAVKVAFDLGVGATTTLSIGGKCGQSSGKALDIDVQITALRKDSHQSFVGSRTNLGDCAAIRTGGIDIVLSSLRNQALGLDLFTNLGIEPSEYKIVIVKSSQHFHHAYANIANVIIYADSPGALSLDFAKIPYVKLKRPVWPLQENPFE